MVERDTQERITCTKCQKTLNPSLFHGSQARRFKKVRVSVCKRCKQKQYLKNNHPGPELMKLRHKLQERIELIDEIHAEVKSEKIEKKSIYEYSPF